jgi:hypothetical protein
VAKKGMFDAARAGFRDEELHLSQTGTKRHRMAHSLGRLVRRAGAVDFEIQEEQRKQAAQLEAATQASNGVNTQALRIITAQAELPATPDEEPAYASGYHLTRGLELTGRDEEGLLWRGLVVGADREPKPGEVKVAEPLPTLTFRDSKGPREFAATRVRLDSHAAEADGEIQPPTSDIYIDGYEVRKEPRSSADSLKPFVDSIHFRVDRDGEIARFEWRMNAVHQQPVWHPVSFEHNLTDFLGSVEQVVTNTQAMYNTDIPPDWITGPQAG